MTQKVDERVLVVPSAELDRLGRFQGFSAEADRYIGALLVPELMEYRPRSQVEDDPGFKQIIPYVVFRSADDIFCYTRGKSQGEAQPAPAAIPGRRRARIGRRRAGRQEPRCLRVGA